MRYGLRGPAFGVVSACAAGAHAIGTAMRTIVRGDADAVVAGGAEAALTPLARAAFAAMDATLDVRRLAPVRRAPRRLRDGRGRGRARARGRRARRGRAARACWRRCAATGQPSDAHHLTAPDAAGAGAARGDRRARSRDAGVAPDDVDYVNAHGTSTPLNDRAETRALKLALGERAARIPVSSTEVARSATCSARPAPSRRSPACSRCTTRIVPPTLGLEQPDPELDLDYVPGSARRLQLSEGASAARDLQLVRLRRAQRGARDRGRAGARRSDGMTGRRR